MTSEQAKQQGLYREAGRLAFAENQQYDNYGCHYGLKSERLKAMSDYRAGWLEAELEARKAGVFATEHDLQVNALFDNKKGLTP